jgi:hypothetical protein
LKGKQPGGGLVKPQWEMHSLRPFTKNFYVPHQDVSNRFVNFVFLSYICACVVQYMCIKYNPWFGWVNTSVHVDCSATEYEANWIQWQQFFLRNCMVKFSAGTGYPDWGLS